MTDLQFEAVLFWLGGVCCGALVVLWFVRLWLLLRDRRRRRGYEDGDGWG